jgi:uncharacterized phiE125 gp8 family phage protein
VLDLVLVTAPASQPLDLVAAKAHLRMDAADTDQDDTLNLLIETTAQQLDGPAGILGRALIAQTWTLYLDRFPGHHGVWSGLRRNCRHDAIRLPLPPLISLVSITYLDGDGVRQTLPVGQYDVRAGEAAIVQPAYGCSWPCARYDSRSIAITFTAGYGAPADLPKPLISAMLLMMGGLFENREDTVVGMRAAMVETTFVKRLLAPFKIART